MSTLLTQEKKEHFLKLYAKSGLIAPTCRAVKISRACFYKWKSEDSEFAAAVKEAEEESTEELEKIAIERAKKVSDTLLIFLLKGRKPEVYKDQQSQQLSGEVVIRVHREQNNRLDPPGTPPLAEGDPPGG